MKKRISKQMKDTSIEKMTGGLEMSAKANYSRFCGRSYCFNLWCWRLYFNKRNNYPRYHSWFLLLIPFVFHSFKSLMHPNIGFKNITAEMASLEELLSLRSEIRSEPINSLEAIKSLKFENVSYYSERGNLESLNFEVKSGEKLGVIALDDYSSDLIFA